MISNERPSPSRPQSPRQPWHSLPPRPQIHEDTLKSQEIQVERKFFTFLLKENPRGRFLRVIEDGGKYSNSIIIPAAGLKEFQKLLAEMLKAADELPPNNEGRQA